MATFILLRGIGIGIGKTQGKNKTTKDYERLSDSSRTEDLEKLKTRDLVSYQSGLLRYQTKVEPLRNLRVGGERERERK